MFLKYSTKSSRLFVWIIEFISWRVFRSFGFKVFDVIDAYLWKDCFMGEAFLNLFMSLFFSKRVLGLFLFRPIFIDYGGSYLSCSYELLFRSNLFLGLPLFLGPLDYRWRYISLLCKFWLYLLVRPFSSTDYCYISESFDSSSASYSSFFPPESDYPSSANY